MVSAAAVPSTARTPGAPPQTATPPAAATATARPSTTWSMTIEVRPLGSSGDAPAGVLLLTVDGTDPERRAWQPIYEASAELDARGHASWSVRESLLVPPFAVTVFGLDQIEGFEPCAGSASEAVLAATDFDAARSATVSFFLCAIPELELDPQTAAPAEPSSTPGLSSQPTLAAP